VSDSINNQTTNTGRVARPGSRGSALAFRLFFIRLCALSYSLLGHAKNTAAGPRDDRGRSCPVLGLSPIFCFFFLWGRGDVGLGSGLAAVSSKV
jgi:hypothetical protein